MDKTQLANLLRKVAAIVETMSDEDFAAVGGSSRGTDSSKGSSRPKRDDKSEIADVEDMFARLNAAESREAAKNYLDGLRLTRRELTSLARRSQVYISKEDTVAHIEE